MRAGSTRRKRADTHPSRPAAQAGGSRGAGSFKPGPLRGRRVPEFYQLMQQAVARWARAQHEALWLARLRLRHRDPCEKFEAIARLLGARCRLWLARVEGRPAGAFVILQGVNAYGFRAAMDEEFKGYHPNDLLV